MTPETKERLDYLRELHAKYNYYWKKYFGFTMSQMAKYMGITKTGFSAIIRGKYDITLDREQAFNKMFEEFQIIEKTKGFKENSCQVSLREIWVKQKNT